MTMMTMIEYYILLVHTIWTLRTGNSPLSENGLIITKPCGVTRAKIVDLGKQIHELKVQINH